VKWLPPDNARRKEKKGNEMTKSELNKHKSVLEAKRAELAHMLRNRDGIAIEKCPDSLDEVQYATERELAIRSLDRDSNLLRNVRAALDRIQEGSFGVCLHCDEDISPKRLAAVPSTAFCIVCQEIADGSQYDGAETLDELLITAA
jgi:DnaK suppressor protein